MGGLGAPPVKSHLGPLELEEWQLPDALGQALQQVSKAVAAGLGARPAALTRGEGAAVSPPRGAPLQYPFQLPLSPGQLGGGGPSTSLLGGGGGMAQPSPLTTLRLDSAERRLREMSEANKQLTAERDQLAAQVAGAGAGAVAAAVPSHCATPPPAAAAAHAQRLMALLRQSTTALQEACSQVEGMCLVPFPDPQALKQGTTRVSGYECWLFKQSVAMRICVKPGTPSLLNGLKHAS